MEPTPLISFLGAALMIGLWGVSALIIIDMIYRSITDPKDDPVKDVLEDYRRGQAEAQRSWREFLRGNKND